MDIKVVLEACEEDVRMFGIPEFLPAIPAWTEC